MHYAGLASAGPRTFTSRGAGSFPGASFPERPNAVLQTVPHLLLLALSVHPECCCTFLSWCSKCAQELNSISRRRLEEAGMHGVTGFSPNTRQDGSGPRCTDRGTGCQRK